MVGEERAYLGYVITCYFQTRYGFRFFQLRSGCEKAEPVPGSFYTLIYSPRSSFYSPTWGFQRHNSYRVAMLYNVFIMQYSTNYRTIFRLFIPHIGSFYSPTWGYQRHNSYRVAMPHNVFVMLYNTNYADNLSQIPPYKGEVWGQLREHFTNNCM